MPAGSLGGGNLQTGSGFCAEASKSKAGPEGAGRGSGRLVAHAAPHLTPLRLPPPRRPTTTAR